MRTRSLFAAILAAAFLSVEARAQLPFVADPYLTPIVARVYGGEVASMGDLNADGVTDFVVTDRVNVQVVVYDGRTTFAFDGYPKVAGSATPLATLSPPVDLEEFGWEIQPAGDVDGDGRTDLVVGAPAADGGGKAYLFRQVAPFGGAHWGAPTTLTLAPGSPASSFGWCVAAAGDVDGDGLGDVLVGAPGPGPGEAALFFGCHLAAGATTPSLLLSTYLPPPGTLDPVGTPVAPLTASGFGTVVMDLGDVDLDGYPDVIVGAPGTTNLTGQISAGAAYVFTFVPASPGATGCASVVPRLLRAHVGTVASEYLGYDAAPAGYYDDDAYPDYVVGALGIDLANTTLGAQCGAAGGPYGHADVYSAAPAPAPQVLMREAPLTHVSRFAAYVSGDPDHDGVARDSDFDGDGNADVLVSDYRRNSAFGPLGAGAYFVYSYEWPLLATAVPGAFLAGAPASVDGTIPCGFLSEATAILPMAELPGGESEDAPRTAVANGPYIEVGAFAGGVVVKDGNAFTRPAGPTPTVRYVSPAPTTGVSWLMGEVEVTPANATRTTVVLVSLELSQDPFVSGAPASLFGFPIYPSTDPAHIVSLTSYAPSSGYRIPMPLSATGWMAPALVGLHSYLQVAELDPSDPAGTFTASDLLILRLGV